MFLLNKIVMTKELLYKEIANIDEWAKRRKEALYTEYVRTNAKYKIGDIICDGLDSIKITRVGYALEQGNIEIFYFGILLTKQLKPRKDGSTRYIYEKNIKF